MANIFLYQEILKLQKACKGNKEEMLRLFELITYLTASKEIRLEDASQLIMMLEPN